MDTTPRTTQTNTLNTHPDQQVSDIRHIARSLKRSELAVRYSRGTIKRSSMAMINFYLRQAGHQFARHPHDFHAVM